jgi:hypothetical protein
VTRLADAVAQAQRIAQIASVEAELAHHALERGLPTDYWRRRSARRAAYTLHKQAVRDGLTLEERDERAAAYWRRSRKAEEREALAAERWRTRANLTREWHRLMRAADTLDAAQAARRSLSPTEREEVQAAHFTIAMAWGHLAAALRHLLREGDTNLPAHPRSPLSGNSEQPFPSMR